ncbi:serine carboxypeptidase PepF [Venturia nashicola]|uniref:Serine carboxypeptidase PepF n=1 Tax=Venturia nashicola TaxID=86259 RepID=A0A4Z1NJ93_9PEZI|nr:serine carboxypeptidase PepF [Venturia nashicola]TLD23381.1 serine carboxypeptidase PepF [Venturia nashicola]
MEVETKSDGLKAKSIYTSNELTVPRPPFVAEQVTGSTSRMLVETFMSVAAGKTPLLLFPSSSLSRSVAVPILQLANDTSGFRVNSLPDVPFSVGEMYPGLMPMKAGDPSRQLFFMYQSTTGPSVDTITIWLNGGPGCSSLAGFLQENGRFLWREEPLFLGQCDKYALVRTPLQGFSIMSEG